MEPKLAAAESRVAAMRERIDERDELVSVLRDRLSEFRNAIASLARLDIRMGANSMCYVMTSDLEAAVNLVNTPDPKGAPR